MVPKSMATSKKWEGVTLLILLLGVGTNNTVDGYVVDAVLYRTIQSQEDYISNDTSVSNSGLKQNATQMDNSDFDDSDVGLSNDCGKMRKQGNITYAQLKLFLSSLSIIKRW